MRIMSITRSLLFSMFLIGVVAECEAGHLHFRCARSRHCLNRKYDYRVAPEVVTSEASGTAIPADFEANVETETEEEGGETEVTVEAQQKRFVIPNITAGPITLSGISAVATPDGCIRLSGILVHSGGEFGHLKGGNASVRIAAVSALGSGDNSTGLSIWANPADSWVKRGEPQPVSIQLNCGDNPAQSQGLFDDLTKIRVLLSYSSSSQ